MAVVLNLALAATATVLADSPCTEAPLQRVADGVWAWNAIDADMSADNGARIVSNVVVSDSGQAWVIDPGPSLQHGLRLRSAVACQVRAAVAAVWNSHAHAENTLGNAAFKSAGAAIPVWATPQTAAAMQSRCPACLAHLVQTIGQTAALGTVITLADHLHAIADHEWQALTLGQRRWLLRAFDHAHSENDLVWWQPEQGVVVAAGLVYQSRLPELAQGRLRNWIAALDTLLELRPTVVIGQRIGGIDDLRRTRAYLCGLTDAVLAALERGETASSVTRLDQPAFAHWVGYSQRQGFNTQRAWRELEAAWMDGHAKRCASDPAH